MTGESLKTKAVKSVMWSSIERFSVQGIQFILSIVIARLVTPSEYGLIAMLSIFLPVLLPVILFFLIRNYLAACRNLKTYLYAYNP